MQDATKQKLPPQQEIAQEIGGILRKYRAASALHFHARTPRSCLTVCAYCRYHDDHSSGDDGDVSVKSGPNARKEMGGHDKADAEIHVVVSRVRRQQIEKARASGALKGVVVERR